VIDLDWAGRGAERLDRAPAGDQRAGGKEGGIPALYHAVARRLGWRGRVQTPLVIRRSGDWRADDRQPDQRRAVPRHEYSSFMSAIATQIAA